MIKNLFCIIKRIIFSFLLLYSFNIMVNPLNIYIPINLITVFFISALGIPALVSFIVIFFIAFWGDYMLKQYLSKQPIPTKILLNSLKKNHLSHAYLFETNSCSYANKYILDFVKHLVCPNINDENHYDCPICKTISEGNYPELKIINPDGQWIKKEQLQDLQKEFNTKATIENMELDDYLYYQANLNSVLSNKSLDEKSKHQ